MCKDKRVHDFYQGINPHLNTKALLKFELAYYDFAILPVSLNATVTSFISKGDMINFKLSIYLCVCVCKCNVNKRLIEN